jgi:hypothetical protein
MGTVMTIQASLLLPLDAAQAFDANVAAFTGDPDAYLVTRDRRGLDRDGDYQQAVTYRRYWPR